MSPSRKRFFWTKYGTLRKPCQFFRLYAATYRKTHQIFLSTFAFFQTWGRVSQLTVQCRCEFETSFYEDLSPYFGDQTMKKLALLCAVAFLTSVSIGCTSSGGSTSSWCRMGSWFPTATTARTPEYYMPAGAYGAYQCNPCEPVSCAPCEPVCNPCEPLCDPCVRTGAYSRGVLLPSAM